MRGQDALPPAYEEDCGDLSLNTAVTGLKRATLVHMRTRRLLRNQDGRKALPNVQNGTATLATRRDDHQVRRAEMNAQEL
jgi:hypothetical protein